MRNLKSTDIFAFCRLVNEIGIKDDIKQIAMGINNVGELNVEDAGFEMMYTIFEKAISKKAEGKIFAFLADIFEIPIKEVENMDPGEFIEMLSGVEGWASFFSSVAKLLKRN